MEMEMTAVCKLHEHKNIYKLNEITPCLKFKGNFDSTLQWSQYSDFSSFDLGELSFWGKDSKGSN